MKLALSNISKNFGEKIVLKDFSYEFKENGIVAITGASGCGKTTLLRIIAGLEKTDSGEVTVNGTVSYMFQEDRLLNWLTPTENITCVLPKNIKNKNEIALGLLKTVGLSGNENTSISALSGGMKRRVAFARALSLSPDILLLDEPFNGLDADNREILIKILKKISDSCLILIVTHDKDDIASLSDEIIAF